MNRAVLGLAILIVAAPAFAQEIDLGLGGDVSSLLNLPAPRGNTPAGRGNAPAPARGAAPNVPPPDRLVRLRELMATANTPLTKEQEAALNALINNEIPLMRQQLQKQVLGAQRGNAPASPGAAPAAPPVLPTMEELAPEIIRLNDQLLGKIASAPVLSPEQQALLKRMHKDQVKSRGGFDAIKLTLEDAGAAFSPEQIAQIQPLFEEQNQARVQLIKQAQGQPPDKAALDQLQRETLGKLLKLLTPAQRTALLAK